LSFTNRFRYHYTFTYVDITDCERYINETKVKCLMLDNTTNVTLSWFEHGALVQGQADKSSLLL